MIDFARRIINAIGFVNDWTGKIVSFFIPAIILMETYEVIMRYGFSRPTIWINELSAMLFGATILLGGAYTMYHKGHVTMDIIHDLFSKRQKAIIDIITFLLFLSFVGVLLWKGWDTAFRSLMMQEHASTQWAPPLYYFKLTLPLGALLLLLQGIAKLMEDVIIAIKGDF